MLGGGSSVEGVWPGVRVPKAGLGATRQGEHRDGIGNSGSSICHALYVLGHRSVGNGWVGTVSAVLRGAVPLGVGGGGVPSRGHDGLRRIRTNTMAVLAVVTGSTARGCDTREANMTETELYRSKIYCMYTVYCTPRPRGFSRICPTVLAILATDRRR
jgi:hypothetical protein